MGLVFLLAASSCLGQEKGSDGNWQDQLDGFFKEYAVAPLESLLFWKIPGLEMPLVVLWLLGGALFFTVRMRFVNIRLFKHAIDLVRVSTTRKTRREKSPTFKP